MSVGFLGIQFGFALQNGNASRILQGFGANVEELPNFWLVAPIIGLLVQPIIGHYSDRTWTKLGRRRPYFLAGAICASIALCLMPNAGFLTNAIPSLWVGAGMLMIMDASFNISMEPFRALVADKLSTEQRTMGFSVQTVLIGIGAVVGSWLPYVLANWVGIPNTAPEGEVAPNVIWSFYTGAIVFMSAIIWTVATTPEYPPEVQAKFIADEAGGEEAAPLGGLSRILTDIARMPKTMKQLGLVQFCSWFALFSMWVFTTPAIAHHIYGCAIEDNSSQTYQDAGDWVGVIFGIYNLVSALYAMLLPRIAARLGRRKTHAVSLTCGAVGLISIYFVKDPHWLIASMLGVGIAWASILSMPYAILAGSLPIRKMGVYMGIFNFFITIPQIFSGVINRPLVKYAFGSEAIYALVMAGVLFLIGAWAVLRVDDPDDVVAHAA
ncbi:MAG: MFS transporter [Saprospiraceae bacterium]|nr:MAG: MFS transporter [Saprospiraceae bacterium]